MLLQSFHIDGLSINTYFVGDEGSGQAVIIDPTLDLDPYIDFAREKGFTISKILETHVHADFVSGSKELKKKLGNKPVIYCSSMGGDEWIPAYCDHPVKRDDFIDFETFSLQPLHTPGHTPEHLIWLCFDKEKSKQVPCLAFTGDLLFVGSVGRPDLLGKNAEKKLAEQLYHSLFVELAPFADFLEIFPAHGAGSLCGKGLSSRPSSTLGYERRFNLYLTPQSKEIWIKKIVEEIPAPPSNFTRLKKINVDKIKKEEAKIPFIIDLRAPLVFSQGHLPNSVNIPYVNSFANWAASIVPPDASIILVAEYELELNRAKKELKLIGFDTVQKEMIWRDEKEKEVLSLIKPADLLKKITEGKPVYVLDIRSEGEWKSGHLKNAIHIELARLPDEIKKISKDQSITVICNSGYRSIVAASFLKSKGFKNVASVCGGMMELKNLGFHHIE